MKLHKLKIFRIPDPVPAGSQFERIQFRPALILKKKYLKKSFASTISISKGYFEKTYINKEIDFVD